ncbi:FKBP-type peptidyl-prolyl cis-trans isomerase [Porphyromonas crevioricanis]|uniref:FKBP-type peptidyl-prolyl cis-trans isomerase n=1 Tax=Porphyromonas crevioricanis TaxID=393921 RepID=UPI00068A8FF6|nr:FKBP-type peptidyl-prolyl cis-trans isomerase [Porphyromonas crevioricanis]
MKRICFLLACSLCVSAVCMVASAANPKKKKKDAIVLKTQIDSVAYAIGALNGEGFRRNLGEFPGDSLDFALVMKSFQQAFEGSDVLISQEQSKTLVSDYFRRMQEVEEKAHKAENEAFMSEYKMQEGVKTTASGLAYKVIFEGNGQRPTVQDTVVVHYVGKTIDGKEFDSSISRGEPATFALLQVIPGWTEGLCLMSPGAKYELVIPQELGYGSRGAGGMIKPYSTLVFEVELLEVKPYVEPKGLVEVSADKD